MRAIAAEMRRTEAAVHSLCVAARDRLGSATLAGAAVLYDRHLRRQEAQAAARRVMELINEMGRNGGRILVG